MMKAVLLVALVAPLLCLASDIVCPTDQPDKIIYYNDPEDCASFYECFNGTLYHQTCPSGLYWNEAVGYCDFPENVDCDATPSPDTTTTGTTKNWDTTVEPDTTEPPCTSTPTPEESTTVEPVTGTDIPSSPTPAPGFTCPNNSGDNEFYADPLDCGAFYECSQGEAIHFLCPGSMLWNNKTQTCDLAENVDCGGSSPLPGTTTETPDLDCPAVTEDIIFIPDVNDCACFYECYMGATSHWTCPTGLLWNPDLNICDYPENVTCATRKFHDLFKPARKH